MFQEETIFALTVVTLISLGFALKKLYHSYRKLNDEDDINCRTEQLLQNMSAHIKKLEGEIEAAHRGGMLTAAKWAEENGHPVSAALIREKVGEL